MLILDQIIHVCYFQFSQQNLQGSKDCYCFFLHMCMFASMQERDRERKKGKEGQREEKKEGKKSKLEMERKSKEKKDEGRNK